MNMATQQTTPPDFTAIKAKQNATWSSGDYGKIGVTIQIVGEDLAEAAGLAPDSKVLDVAAGNGNATLAFARRWCRVTSTDYVDTLLAGGRKRVEVEGLKAEFQVADVEALPFAEGSFDAVVSTFGVMFAPNQEQAATEMMRVCRSGGRIAMANWTPDGFIGQLFKTIGRHVPPPPGVASPARWGTRVFIETAFGDGSASVSLTPRNFNFRYRSAEHFLDFFRTFYGPVHKAFMALDEAGQAALDADIRKTIERFNVATDGTMIVPSEYVEVIVDKA